MKDSRYTIFEALNETRKEVYIGITDRPVHETIARYRYAAPPEIGHWSAEDAVTYSSLDFNLASSHAEDCVAAHVKKVDRPGWTIIAGTRPRR